MWSLVSRMMALFTRLLLNHFCRRYLKQRLRRVMWSISENRIELLDVALDTKAMRSVTIASQSRLIAESCRVSKLEVVAPKFGSLLRRRPSGFSLQLTGVFIAVRLDDKIDPDSTGAKPDVVGALASKKDWQTKILVAARAWLAENVACHSHLMAKDIEIDLSHPCGQRLVGRCSVARFFANDSANAATHGMGASEVAEAQDVGDKGSASLDGAQPVSTKTRLLSQGAVSWEGLSVRIGRDRFEFPGGYVKIGRQERALAAELHLNVPRAALSAPFDSAPFFFISRWNRNRGEATSAGGGASIIFSLSVKGSASIDVSSDASRSIAIIDGGRFEWDPCTSFFIAKASDVRVDGIVQARFSQLKLQRSRRDAHISLMSSPRAVAFIACDDPDQLSALIEAITRSGLTEQPGPCSQSRSRPVSPHCLSTPTFRAECPGGLDIRLCSVFCSFKRPAYTLSDSGWTAEAAHLVARAGDSLVLTLVKDDTVGPLSSAARRATIGAFSVAFDRRGMDNAAFTITTSRIDAVGDWNMRDTVRREVARIAQSSLLLGFSRGRAGTAVSSGSRDESRGERLMVLARAGRVVLRDQELNDDDDWSGRYQKSSARLDGVEYRLTAKDGDKLTIAAVECSGLMGSFEATGLDSRRTRMVSDDEGSGDEASNDAAIDVSRSFHDDPTNATISAFVRRGLLRLVPPLQQSNSSTGSAQGAQAGKPSEGSQKDGDSINGMSSIRVYLALYDCDVEYSPQLDDSTGNRDLEAAVRVGFARFGAMLCADRQVAVCSTRVRDLELDVLDRRQSKDDLPRTCKLREDDRRARLATLDVFDAVSKGERDVSSILITSGTLRLYVCHDSLQSVVDLCNALSRDARRRFRRAGEADSGMPMDTVNDDDEASTLGLESSLYEEDDTSVVSTSDRGCNDSSRLLVENYVPKCTSSEDEEEADLAEVTVETPSRMIVVPDEIELDTMVSNDWRRLRAASDATVEDEATVICSDDDGGVEGEPAAAWYAADDINKATTLVREHFQKQVALEDGVEDIDDDDIVDEEPEFRFEIRSTAVCCRLFAGSEWEHSTSSDESRGSRVLASHLLTSLLDVDSSTAVGRQPSISATERGANNRRRRRRGYGRNLDKLCEVLATGLRIRFVRPYEKREAFRLETTIKDFKMTESVSTESGALRPALEHWRSNARHPRQTKDPMLRIVAHSIEEAAGGGSGDLPDSTRRRASSIGADGDEPGAWSSTCRRSATSRKVTRAKLRLLPLRCRLDAEFLRFVDAFFGTLELDSADDRPRRRERAEVVDREDDAVWIDDDCALETSPVVEHVSFSGYAPRTAHRRGFEASLAVLEVAPWKLKVDYIPRGVDASALRRGSLSELLHLFALERVELDLRRCRASSATLAGALERVRAIWAAELREEQLHRFVAGAEPVRPIAAVGVSAVDLLAAPVAESLVKGNRGRPLRQLSKSTATFAGVTAFEAARASRKVATKLADAIDGALPPAHRSSGYKASGITRLSSNHHKQDAPPRDARQGLERARDAFKRSLDGASEACAAVVARPSVRVLRTCLGVYPLTRRPPHWQLLSLLPCYNQSSAQRAASPGFSSAWSPQWRTTMTSSRLRFADDYSLLLVTSNAAQAPPRNRPCSFLILSTLMCTSASRTHLFSRCELAHRRVGRLVRDWLGIAQPCPQEQSILKAWFAPGIIVVQRFVLVFIAT